MLCPGLNVVSTCDGISISVRAFNLLERDLTPELVYDFSIKPINSFVFNWLASSENASYAASQTTLLHMKILDKTESLIFVIFCVLCFQRQPFFIEPLKCKTVAEDILFCFNYFSEKIRLGISDELFPFTVYSKVDKRAAILLLKMYRSLLFFFSLKFSGLG